MDLHIDKSDDAGFAELISDEIIIKETQDALDLMMSARYSEADYLLVKRHQIIPGFFDLKTRIAGDILQKFSTYGAFLAIIGDFSNEKSQSLKDFMMESNKHGRIIFVESIDKAKAVFLERKR